MQYIKQISNIILQYKVHYKICSYHNMKYIEQVGNITVCSTLNKLVISQYELY